MDRTAAAAEAAAVAAGWAREEAALEWASVAVVTAPVEAEPAPVPEDSPREADYCYRHPHHHTR
jgi:hypothetical protein